MIRSNYKPRTKVIQVYLENTLFVLMQEGVLAEDQRLTASSYLRNLVFNDLKARDLITSEIMECLLTGQTPQTKAS